MKVIKRDGKEENFERTNILRAIKKANSSVDKEKQISDEEIENVLNVVVNNIPEKDEKIEIEKIQDLVEDALMERNHFEIAKSYILYREERAKERFKKLSIVKEIREKLNASNIQNQNANVDEASFGGRKGEADSALLKQLALDYYISPKFAKNHINNRIYIHDLDSYVVGEHNCLSVPIDDLLANGFKTRQVFIRPAGSVNTAFQLVAVLFQLQSLQQFGGVAATHLDWSLVPYVRKSFMKHYIVAGLKDRRDFYKINLPELMFEDYQDEAGIWRNKLEDWIEENKEKLLSKFKLKKEDFYFDNKKLNKKYRQQAIYDTIQEVKQAAEGMLHNLNSLQSRSGNQLPFSSINYGTCTEEEGRIITKAILNATIKGVGNGQTSIFPCQIFQKMKGVNDKGSKNYDLYKMAIRSTAKRMYPNYVNCDWSKDQGYNKKDPRTYPSTMGCLGGKEHLYIKINDDIFDVSIKQFFEMCKSGDFCGRKAQVFFNKENNDNNLKIKIVRNRPFEHKSGVYKITHIPTDTTYIGSTSDIKRRFAEHRNNIAKHGGLDSGVNYNDNLLENYSFEVIEYCNDYAEEEKKYIEKIPNVNFKGTSQQYYKLSKATKNQNKSCKPTLKIEYEPQELISLEDKNIKVLDIDGNWVKIKHIFRNTPKASPLMMHIYYKEYEHTYEIDATNDHPFFNGKDFTKAEDLKVGDKLYRADGLELEIINVVWAAEKVESFDIGTESGTFVGSDIKMHNCRTYSSWDINAPSEELSHLKDGRGNIAPATIILPTLAMEAKKRAKDNPEYIVDYFMDILKTAISDCKDELIERYNWICAQSPASARFMYENNTFYSYGDDFKNEGIRGALKHGTLAIGQIGLAETLQILIGTDQTTEKGMELAKEIENLFMTKCKEYKENYKLNFGVYYTPAENLCYTSFNKFVKKYGLIENVTAHKNEKGELVPRGYFTNSMHVPVWKEITPFEKIDIESQLTGYSSAGCITYVEIGDNAQNNLTALEQIVDYAMAKDIPYFALNVKFSDCEKCGYSGYIDYDAPCPKCGASHDYISDYARITGYLSTKVKHFNKGKQMETRDRFTHVNKLPNWKK